VLHELLNPTGNYVNYQDTVSLVNGCYRLRINDSDDDGISFWANNDGGGFVRVKGVGESWNTIATDFGQFIEYEFTVGGVLPVEETSSAADIFEVFPNPSGGELQIDLEFGEAQQVGLIITDMLGNVVHQQDYNGFRSGRVNLDLSNTADGVYFCTIATAYGTSSKRFVLSK